MLYKLIHDKNTFDLNPELLAIPEFAKLLTTNPTVKEEDRDRRMKFCILVADRRSPLRTLPEKERREKAARIVGYPLEGNRLDKNGRDAVAGNNESIEKAITKYRELQYDENADTLETINAQIREIKEYIKSDKKIPITDDKGKVVDHKVDGKAVESAMKLSKQLPELIKAKQDIETLLNIVTDYKPEIQTYTNLDFQEPEESTSEESLSTIDKYHQNRK